MVGTAISRPVEMGPVDLDFLKTIGEVLRALEEGRAADTDTVRAKVDALQHQFARARESLEAMDGAEMSVQMQDEMAAAYNARLGQLRDIIGIYSELPVFAEKS